MLGVGDRRGGNNSFKLFSIVSHIQIISSYDILPQMVNFINDLLTLTISSCRGHSLPCIGVSSCFKAKMSLMTLSKFLLVFIAYLLTLLGFNSFPFLLNLSLDGNNWEV